MKHLMLLSLVILTGLLRAQTLSSPNGNLQLTFSLTEEGEPMYSLQYKGKMVIADSKMGFTIMAVTKWKKIVYGSLFWVNIAKYEIITMNY